MKLLDIGESITTEAIDLDALQSRLYDLEAAQKRAREITKNIKYAEMHMDIIRELENLAEEVGLTLDEYNVNQVYQAKNNLESAIYELEEAFEDAIRDAQNAVDDAEYDMEEGRIEDTFGTKTIDKHDKPQKKKKKEVDESLKALARHVKEGVPLPDSLFRYQSESYFDTFTKAKQLREAGSLPELDWESEEMLGTDIGESVELKGIGKVWLDVPYLNESDDEYDDCEECGGDGIDLDTLYYGSDYDKAGTETDCSACGGTGQQPKEESVNEGQPVNPGKKEEAMKMLKILHKQYVRTGQINAFELPVLLRQHMPELSKPEIRQITGEFFDNFKAYEESQQFNEMYDKDLISMLARFEDDCNEFGYYGDTDVVTINNLIQQDKLEDAAEEMAGAMSDQDGGSDRFDYVYDLAKDRLEDYAYEMSEAKGDIRKAAMGVGLAGMLGLGIGAVDKKLDQQAYSASEQLPKLELYLDHAKQQGDQRMVKQLQDRLRNHKFRLEMGKGDVVGSNGQPIEVVYDKEGKAQGPVKEAEYNGKDVELNKPKRGGSKKYYVYVKNPKTGRVKKISFGDVTGLKTKAGNKKRAKSFAARHNCEKKNDKMKAGYWACRLPRYGLVKGGQWW